MLTIDLSGRHAVITGGASGIGLACARVLRACGAQATLVDLDEDRLLSLEGEGFGIHRLDVTDARAVRAAAKSIDEAQPVDILVTAAGILQRPAAPDRFTDNEWSRVIDTNLKGTYLCLARFGEAMAQRGRGSIVTIASVMGLVGTPLHAYGPAKAGVVNLTAGLAGEWAEQGVRVNTVAPGFARTPALERGLNVRVLEEARLAGSSAMGRLVTTDEIGAAVAFLSSDLASGITGVTLPVDCGFLAGAGWSPFEGDAS